MSESMIPEVRAERYKAALDFAVSVTSKCMIDDDCFDCKNRQFTFEALNDLRHRLSEAEQVASENAQIANDRAAVIVTLSSCLIEIVNKWVPALLRDAFEADKTNCNAHSIRGIVVKALPGRNFK